LGPSETIFLAIGWNPTPTIVAVKEERVSDTSSLRGIVPTSHVNIVKLKDAYYWSETCFLVYDRMHISLEHLCRLESSLWVVSLAGVVSPAGVLSLRLEFLVMCATR
jgi:hypothetical protein